MQICVQFSCVLQSKKCRVRHTHRDYQLEQVLQLLNVISSNWIRSFVLPSVFSLQWLLPLEIRGTLLLRSFMEGALRLGLDSSKNVLKETVLQLSPCLPVLLCTLYFICIFLLNYFFCFSEFLTVKLGLIDFSRCISVCQWRKLNDTERTVSLFSFLKLLCKGSIQWQKKICQLLVSWGQ